MTSSSSSSTRTTGQDALIISNGRIQLFVFEKLNLFRIQKSYCVAVAVVQGIVQVLYFWSFQLSKALYFLHNMEAMIECCWVAD